MRPEPVERQVKGSIAGIAVRFTPGRLRKGLPQCLVNGCPEPGQVSEGPTMPDDMRLIQVQGCGNSLQGLSQRGR